MRRWEVDLGETISLGIGFPWHGRPSRNVSLVSCLLAFAGFLVAGVGTASGHPDPGIESALSRAGANRSELVRALGEAPRSQKEGVEFLVRHMPDHDLRSITASHLLEEVGLAYRAWSEAPWKDRVPPAVFFNDVLPYAVVSEERTPWRRFLFARVAPLVAETRTPGEAAVRLNQELFDLFGVRYSTERSRTDQNPMEVIGEGKATCTGLSVLLIAACRSVGVPARLAGTPLWADSSGNHSWVEVWDDGWQFTGAAEPTGDRLNDGWFVDKASRARADLPLHSIYATSWAPTGTEFPLAWDEDGSLGYVHAFDVTDRYAGSAPTPAGQARVEFVVRDRGGRRVPTAIAVRIDDRSIDGHRPEVDGGSIGGTRARDSDGAGGRRGRTRDESADGNDHLALLLDEGRDYVVEIEGDHGPFVRAFRARDGMLLVLASSNGSSEAGVSGVTPADRGAVSAPDGWGRPRR